MDRCRFLATLLADALAAQRDHRGGHGRAIAELGLVRK
jgi:hypothetical protein